MQWETWDFGMRILNGSIIIIALIFSPRHNIIKNIYQYETCTALHVVRVSIHLAGWETILLSEEEGGLGAVSSRGRNPALSGNLAWRVGEDSRTCARLIKDYM